MKNLAIIAVCFVSALLFQTTTALSIENSSPENLSYADLFPSRHEAHAPASGTDAIRKILDKRSNDFKSCLGTLNSQTAMNGAGVARARSGSINVLLKNDPNTVVDIKVKLSAFRYENVESCLLHSLEEDVRRNAAAYPEGEALIVFLIDCDLRRLSDNSWTRSQVARTCSLKWEVR